MGKVCNPQIHSHWYYDRFTTLLQAPILEPLRIISRRSANTALNSTKRLPSGFEIAEKRERKCGLCRAPGHTRNSYKCPIRLQRRLQEVEASTSNSTIDIVQSEVLEQDL